MFIQWQSSYSVGVARIDDQHQQLVAMLNALYEKLGPDLIAADVWPMLDGFNRYADRHFQLEARFARDFGISANEFREHQAAHDHYRQRMQTFRHSLDNGDRYAPVQLMSFLASWWTDHICGIDAELGRQLVDRGAR